MKQHTLDLILFKALADLRVESGRKLIGHLWWILDPVIVMVTFYIVFAVILERGTEHYVPFLLVGIVAWRWFSTSVSRAGGSILANRSLLFQVYVPKYVFPAAVLLADAFKFLIVLVLLLVFIHLYGLRPSAALVHLPLLLAVQFLLIGSVSLLVAAFVPVYPDIQNLVGYVLRLMFYLSGVFFSIAELSPAMQQWLYLNPMAVLITAYRTVLIDGQAPAVAALLPIIAGSASVGLLGLLALRHFDRRYAKLIFI